MKKFIVIFMFIIIYMVTLVFNNNIYAKEKEMKNETDKVKASGAVLIDNKRGRVLWEKNSNSILSMASTTKIMTAIIALEEGNLNDIVKISRNATTAPKVKMYLTEKEEIKLEYLLYAIMLQSYNDAAVAIAEHISGDVETFCKTMTNKAKEIGAFNTSFETPNGLDGEKHYSTPYDMAIITKYAMKNKKFRNIINTKSMTIGSNRKLYNISNKNRLLLELEGANGVKTGFTNKAGHCFVGSAKRNDVELISVVLGSGWGKKGKEQKWIDTKIIMNYGFDNFKNRKIVSKNEIINKKVKVQKSKDKYMKLYFEEDFSLLISKDELKNTKIIVKIPKEILAPVKKDTKLGKAEIYINNKLEKEIDLLSLKDAEKYNVKSYMEKIFDTWINLSYDDIISKK